MPLEAIRSDPGVAQPHQILDLQRQVGNQAIQRLLDQHTLQAKLTVGPAGDAYEQEADRVASQVMSSSPTAVQRSAEEEEEVQARPLAGSITPLVQRAAEEEEEIQTKPLLQRAAEEEEEVQAKPLLQRAVEEEEEIQTRRVDPAAGFQAADTLEAELRAQAGHGQALPGEVRAFMEPRFGADFSGVRVHTDAPAQQLNRQLSAQAFTHGQDIYLGEGRYAPETDTGKHLLAHELTHVVQQTGKVAGPVQRVFDADKPGSYDDDGGHAMAQHGAALDESHHTARAKTNTPTFSSSGWASNEMMKTAVTKALATHTGQATKKTATKWKMKWTVNVSLPKCGFTWLYDSKTDKVTKTVSDTAVVIFSVEERTGRIAKMTTAFPGGPAKDFNATA